MSRSCKKVCYSDFFGLSDGRHSDEWKSAITIVPCDKNMAPFPVQLNEDNSEVSAMLLITQLFLYLEGCSKNPMIKVAAVYKTPLDSMFSIVSVGYHAIVYLGVEDYHLTIEKHDVGITIQVSKQKSKVLQQFKKSPRKGVPELIVHDEAKMNFKKLIKFIVKKNFTHENYNVWKGIHCKKFAKDIFDRAAAIEQYKWEEDETIARGGVLTTAAAITTAAVTGITGGIAALFVGAAATASAAFTSKERKSEPDSESTDSDTTASTKTVKTSCWNCCFCRDKKK